LIALKLQHCYPFGNGQGFLRTTNISTKNIPAKSGTGMKFDVTVEPSDIVLFEEQNGGLVTKILDDETVRQEFDLKPGCRFLGKLDNFLFYWNQRDEDTIVGRDTTTDKVYSWKVPGVYVVEGVLRGIKYDYGIVVYRKISGFLSNAMGEKAVIEVSVKDAVVEPKRQP